MLKQLSNVKQFIEVDLWRLRLSSLPKTKRYFYAFIRVVVISVKEFAHDRGGEKASALTYFSMLSLVPVLALIFAIAKAFGIRKLLETELERYFSGQTEILSQVQPYVDKMLNTQGSDIATLVSAIFLIYTVVKLLMNIEAAFNDMWEIKKNRRWERKISDYVAIILLGPVLLIVAGSATVVVRDSIQGVMADLAVFDQLKSGIAFLLTLLPYTILWLLLFGLYLIFPNTRVRIFPALVAGIVAGTLYQLNQQAFISLQFLLARYNAIYGSIAFLPLFLIWLQISWIIVLFGAEVCYGIQYVDQWEMNPEKLRISQKHTRKLMLLILYRVVKKFESDEGAKSINELATSINIPRKYIIDIAYDLERSGLITRVDAIDPSYQPAFDIHKMTLHKVIEKYESEGMSDFDPRKSEIFQKIEHAMEQIDLKWKSTDADLLLKDL